MDYIERECYYCPRCKTNPCVCLQEHQEHQEPGTLLEQKASHDAFKRKIVRLLAEASVFKRKAEHLTFTDDEVLQLLASLISSQTYERGVIMEQLNKLRRADFARKQLGLYPEESRACASMPD